MCKAFLKSLSHPLPHHSNNRTNNIYPFPRKVSFFILEQRAANSTVFPICGPDPIHPCAAESEFPKLSRMKNLSAPRAFTHPIRRAFISLFFSLSLLAFYSQSIIPKKNSLSSPGLFPDNLYLWRRITTLRNEMTNFCNMIKIFSSSFPKNKKAEQRARKALDKIVCVYRGK